MDRIGLGIAILLAALAFAGCSQSHGGGGTPCGPTTCEVGTVCCNSSCGICVAPGGGCPAVYCEPDAGPPEDAGGLVCGDEICGVGARCCSGCSASESYCAPLGEPCPRPACLDAGVDGGPARSCGGWTGAVCEPGELCDYPPGSYCGGDDSLGVCRPRPDACPLPSCIPVCGCDGQTYCSPCDANANGTSVAREGACEPTSCERMDATGDGLCDAFFGYAWDGSACVGISGCSCVGADCGRLYHSPDVCDAAHTGCADDCRTRGCPTGSRCEICWTSYACIPDGAVC